MLLITMKLPPFNVQYVQFRGKSLDNFDKSRLFPEKVFDMTKPVYYNDIIEKETAEKMIAELEEKSEKKVWISLEPFSAFYTAEEEHQDYYIKHPEEFEKELIESGRKQI